MKQTFFYKTFLTLLLGMGSIAAWAGNVSINSFYGNFSAGGTVFYDLAIDDFPNGLDRVEVTLDGGSNVGSQYLYGIMTSSVSGSFTFPNNLTSNYYSVEFTVFGADYAVDGYAQAASYEYIDGVAPPEPMSLYISAYDGCEANYTGVDASVTNGGSSPDYRIEIDGYSYYSQYVSDHFSPGYHSVYVHVTAGSDAPVPYSETEGSSSFYVAPAKQPYVYLYPSGPICYNAPVTFQATGGELDGGSYKWFRNGTEVPGETVTSLTLNNLSKTTPENISVQVSGISGCTYSSNADYSAEFLANPTPNPVVTASGSKIICEGNSVDLSNVPNQNNGYYFYWSDANGDNVGYDYHYNADQSGTYTLTVVDPNTGCERYSSPQVVTVKPNPTVDASANGKLAVCTGGSLVLSNSVNEPGVTYRWKRGATNVSSTNAYTAKTAGSYALTATLSGCTVVSPTFDVSILANPDVTVTNNGTSLCSNTAQDITLSATYDNNYNYQWYNGTTAIPTATEYEYITNIAGTYSVAVSNGSCPAKTSTATKITSTTMPAAVITQTGITPDYVSLRGNNGAYTYQWYFNNSPMPGKTGQTLIATMNGVYKLELMRNGCSVMSNDKTVSGLSEIPLRTMAVEETQTISIYPNPSEGVFNIGSQNAVNLIVRDVQGKVIANITNAAQVDLTAQPAGMYLIQIMDAKGNLLQSERLMKK